MTASHSLQGNQSVQIHDVDRSSIQINFSGQLRTVPLEPAEFSVSTRAQSPTTLVRARSGIVPYAAREELMHELVEWLDTAEPFAGQVIGGKGGSGKTRLAVELCKRLEGRNWLCGFLSGITDPAALDALVTVPTARLVVVDYAESRLEQLEVLLPLLAKHASEQAPVRVLLLVRASPRRTTDWAERLRNRSDSLDALLDECLVRGLEDSPLGMTEREGLFSAAAAAFAERLGSAPAPDPPQTLPDEVFASPLLVVIAAYLSVHDGEAPSTRSALLDEVLAHEQRHWRASTGDLFSDDVLPRRVVGLATLAGARSEAEAAELLRLLPDLQDAPAERRTRLARWAHDEYPGPRWWNPLEPDLVGEHLVADSFTDQPAVLTGVLQREEATGVTQPIEVFARAAADHPALGAVLKPIISTELERLCKIAVRQAATEADHDLLYGNSTTVAAAIDRAITAIGVEVVALVSVIGLMPQRPDLLLGSLAVTLVAEQVKIVRVFAATDPATWEQSLGNALSHLSARLGDVGRAEEGLVASEESIAIHRNLASEDSAISRAGLASALQNLSNRYADVGRRKDALLAIEEAAEISRELAAADPETYEDIFSRSLNNLSVRREDPEEALAAIEEVIAIRRPLAATNPSYIPLLAGSLQNLSVRLADVGRAEEALLAVEESVTMLRTLAASNPAGYEAGLAKGLHNLENCLGALERDTEALVAAEESAAINRRLAAVTPAIYETELASSLNNLSNRLAYVGRAEEALRAIEETVEINRRLAAANPAVREGDLAGSLNNLSNRLAYAGRAEEALRAIEESIDIRHRLTEADPTPNARHLLVSLNNLPRRLEAVGRNEEAEQVRQRLAESGHAATDEPGPD